MVTSAKFRGKCRKQGIVTVVWFDRTLFVIRWRNSTFVPKSPHNACGNLTKIWSPTLFILLPTILGTNGYEWGLLGTKFHGDYKWNYWRNAPSPQKSKSSHWLPTREPKEPQWASNARWNSWFRRIQILGNQKKVIPKKNRKLSENIFGYICFLAI